MRSLFLVLLLGVTVNAQDVPPTSPQEAVKKIVLPKGFKATLFAAEPDIVQPIAFTFDDRGRMWVVENFSYPKFNTDGKGKDRVTVLEDTDGDGTFNKKTVVIDNGANLTGIEYGHGGIFLCSAPNLLFVPIKDDKPSGPPVVILDGWNYKEAKHNVFSNLAWGPDGWLYGCNGIQATSYVGRPGTPKEQRTAINCGIWRVKPTEPHKYEFEVVATGMTNPWGLDWDQHGNMFATNCVIDHLFHIVPGGKYKRMHGKDLDPFAYELMDSCVDYKHWAGGHWTASRNMTKEHDEAGGGHAHSGCCVYLGDNFPEEYRNTVFSCNIHGNRLNNDGLEMNANGIKGVRRPDFMFAKDPWFRGIACKYGPDGGLYVCDWYDTGECHNYVKVDQTNGRIYKIVYGNPKPWTGDLGKMTDKQLIQLQLERNEWLVRHARRVLHERAVGNKLGKNEIVIANEYMDFSIDPISKLKSRWLVEAVGGTYYDNDKKRDSDTYVRIAKLRSSLRRHDKPLNIEGLSEEYVFESQANFTTPFLGMMQNMPDKIKLGLTETILKENRFSQNRNNSLMLWFAIGSVLSENESLAVEYLVGSREGIIREFFARQHGLNSRYDFVFVQAFNKINSDIYRIELLRGLKAAVLENKGTTKRPQWLKFSGTEAWSADSRRYADEISIIFGDKERTQLLLQRISNPTVNIQDRLNAIDLLASANVPDLAHTLFPLLADKELRGPAIKALTRYTDKETPAAILKHYTQFTATEKADAVLCLSGRKDYAHALLDAVGTTVAKGDISGFNARQILALNDKTLAAKLETQWGTVRAASATKVEQTNRLKKLLTADAISNANGERGKALYTKTCASCHKLYGEGGDVGPDLTGGQRANLDYVIENVLDPNAVVPYDMKMTVITMQDGRVISGIIRKETPDAVTVRTANDTLVLNVKEIDNRKKTELSLMPEGLLDAMKDQEIIDLIAFFSGKK